MKISELYDSDIKTYLKITDFENFFNVFDDQHGYKFFNLNENLYFDVEKDSLQTLVCDCECFWPLISYKLYGTTRLTWLLWKLNDITPENVFEIKHPGDVIYYIDKQNVESIIANLNNFK